MLSVFSATKVKQCTLAMYMQRTRTVNKDILHFTKLQNADVPTTLSHICSCIHLITIIILIMYHVAQIFDGRILWRIAANMYFGGQNIGGLDALCSIIARIIIVGG